jgi:ABC-type transporter Mla subunit MlaD
VADFQLKVTAETQDAEKKLQSIDKAATEVTRDRPIKIEIPNYSELSKNLSDLKKDIGDAANTVKQFYRVAGQLPVGPVKDINEMAAQLKNVATAANDTRKNVGDAGDVIRTTLDTAGTWWEDLLELRLAFMSSIKPRKR